MGSKDDMWKPFPPVPCNLEDYVSQDLIWKELDLDEIEDIDLPDDKNGPDLKKKKLIPRRMIERSCEAKSGPSMTTRKRQAPNKSPKAIAKGKGKGKWKSTKKMCPTSFSDVGEPSEAFQQPASKGTEKPVEELIKTKTVDGVKKILGDRIDRQAKKDEKEDKNNLLLLTSFRIDPRFFSCFEPITQSLITKSQRPMRSELYDIKNELKNMEGDAGKLDDKKKMDVLPKLKKIEQDIKSLDEKREKYEEKVAEVTAMFTAEEGRYSVDNLKEKLSELIPRHNLEENATDKLPKANNHEEITATEELQCYDQTRTEFTVKDMEKLEKELFDHHRNVGFSDFSGLEDVKGAEVPDYLKSIAKKVEEDRGEPTIDVYRNILLFVSAAVKEMEDLAVDELDWPILLKWAATFNLAKQLQFQVKFVEKLLKKNMHAYFNRELISTSQASR